MSSFGDGLPAANVAAVNIEELRESNRRDSRTPLGWLVVVVGCSRNSVTCRHVRDETGPSFGMALEILLGAAGCPLWVSIYDRVSWVCE